MMVHVHWLLLALFVPSAWSWPSWDFQAPVQAAKSHRLHLTHDLLGFHQNLTQIESVTGNESYVGEWLAHSLESQGYHVEKQVVSEHPPRFNVLAWPGQKREAQVLLSSHMDTVSSRPFFSGEGTLRLAEAAR